MRHVPSPAPALRRSTLKLGLGLLGLFGSLAACRSGGEPLPPDLDQLLGGLTAAARADYTGDKDGGLAHVTYWTLKPGAPEYAALPKREQDKLAKIQGSVLHSAKLQPTALVAGTEITGTLTVPDEAGDRVQELVLKVPAAWNGRLVVVGTPGTRNEFASEAVFVPWLLSRGYACVSGNKGMTNGGADGNATLLNKAHPTRHWGVMMLDLATWARDRLTAATGVAPAQIYAAGLSNGGYQVRRALEIDHERTLSGSRRLFSGGLEWAGVYWPDARVLDTDRDGTVTPREFAAAPNLVSDNEHAALAIGWAYDAGTLATPAAYKQSPPFSAAHAELVAAGFRPESAVLWGAYSKLFDGLKATLPAWKGVGYYNLTAYFYRADLLGHDVAGSAPYAMWADASGNKPPFYDYVKTATDGGWTADGVRWALKNATTGVFSAPLISIHGDRDALIGLTGHGDAYAAAVRAAGTPSLHRLYVIQNGNHVDTHADGALDYDCNGTPGDEGAADLLTPMQPYAERAFQALVDWAEAGKEPPASRTVPTDPKNDVLDAAKIQL